MTGILQNLLKLQGLEFNMQPGKKDASEAAALRATIPHSMLGQYERQRARGKKSIVEVRNQVCTNCRMQVPIGVMTQLMRGEAQVCGSCGRYLCLPEPVAAVEIVDAPVAPKPARKPRKRKALAAVA
jgi:predicted  nucleic acid-binding Zn-ribbon protein